MNDYPDVAQAFCPQCNGEVDSDARFCKHCAFDLKSYFAPKANTASDTAPETLQTKPRNNLTFILGGLSALVLVAILAFAGIYLFMSRSQSDTANSNSASTLTIGPKAQKAEEKILRGEALTQDDLAGLTNDELRIVRNVHFARYGRKYERPGLGDYFFTRSWYKPNESYSDSMVNATDKANINLILAMEKPSNTVVATT